jgi:hypothetical protein
LFPTFPTPILIKVKESGNDDRLVGQSLAAGKSAMRNFSLPSAVALAVAALAFAGPAAAQSCPPDYYFASDGRCYPSGPPPAPPPVYYAPPVRQPPPVYDGFALGIGLGALVGVLGSHHGGGGDHRGHDDRGHGRR